MAKMKYNGEEEKAKKAAEMKYRENGQWRLKSKKSGVMKLSLWRKRGEKP